MKRSLAVALAVVLGATMSSPTRAETKRVAVVVGNNVGASGQPLRYAEADAAKFARVLVELAGVEVSDLFLLEGKSPADLRAALAAAAANVKAKLANPSDRVLLFFYFSGHSDGTSLEQGGERVPFSEIKRWLAAAGANVRIGVVDACNSGAFLTAKGGSPGASFRIHLRDELATSGDVLLASSATDEVALESSEIGGSYFTHHLVSGLRGAADTSGDGRVTLSEAHAYAYGRTLRTTSETIVGVQHPSFDYRLSGHDDLVLTELTARTASMALPSNVDRALVVSLPRGQVIAEVTAPGVHRVALAPGRYSVRVWQGTRAASAVVSIAAGEARTLSPGELTPVTPDAGVRAKGEAEVSSVESSRERSDPGGIAAAASFGVLQGASSASGFMPALRIGAGPSAPSGPSITVLAARGARSGFDEAMALGLAGYRFGIRRGRLTGAVGLEVGGGAVLQEIDGRGTAASGAFGGGPRLGGAVHIGRSWAVTLEASALFLGVRRDAATALVTSPGVWLGAELTP